MTTHPLSMTTAPTAWASPSDAISRLADRTGAALQRFARRRTEHLALTREEQQRRFATDRQLDAAMRAADARAFDARRGL